MRAIKLEDDDEVVSMELVQPDEELAGSNYKWITVSGLRSRNTRYRQEAARDFLLTTRASSRRQVVLIGAMVVDDDDEDTSDQFRRHYHPHQRLSEVSKLGRATQGVKIMRTDEEYQHHFHR